MISIVMAYFNRREQLIRTLYTISKSTEKDLEIIIVDDASDESQRIIDIPDMFGMDIQVKEIKNTQKQWRNPCVPFNIGFKIAHGDTIVIQSPECIHVGDVLSYIKENVSNKKYISMSCYALTEQNIQKFEGIDFHLLSIFQLQQSLIKVCGGLEEINKQRILDGNIWYCHPEFRSWSPHFTAAISRKVLLEKFGGFDERYRNGSDYDDTEFWHRIKKSNLEIIVPNPKEFPFVIHQFHKSTNTIKDKETEKINAKVFKEKTLKEIGWKVN